MNKIQETRRYKILFTFFLVPFFIRYYSIMPTSTRILTLMCPQTLLIMHQKSNFLSLMQPQELYTRTTAVSKVVIQCPTTHIFHYELYCWQCHLLFQNRNVSQTQAQAIFTHKSLQQFDCQCRFFSPEHCKFLRIVGFLRLPPVWDLEISHKGQIPREQHTVQKAVRV